MMRRVILAGCGHTHLEVVRNADAFHKRSAELLLVDPGMFWYSGRGSGLLGGRFTRSDAAIDPEALAHACGAGHRRGLVVGIDRASRSALLSPGEPVRYDLLSFDIGSRASNPFGSAAAPDAESVKPIGNLPALRQHILGAARPLRIVVLGGGATGCEIAGNLLHLSIAHGLGLEVTLVGAAAEVLAGAPAGLRRRASASLRSRGARLVLGCPAAAMAANALRLENGQVIEFDRLILATGLEPDPVVKRLGLPFRDAGLRVGATLQSIADPDLFAAGDCAAIEGHDLPKVGVYGVRAGPVLLRNLLARLDGRPLKDFRPQKTYLSIVDLADGQGLAMRGGAWFAGRPALWLKHRLDGDFVRRYQRVYDGC